MSTVFKTVGENEGPENDPRLAWRKMAYVGSLSGMVFVMVLVVLPIVVRGIRIGFPSLSIPSWIGIDGAVVLAWIFVFGVPFFWRKILQLWLGAESVFDAIGRNEDNHKLLIWVLGFVGLFADSYGFYCGASETEGEWGDAGFSFGAFVLTLGYMAMVVSMSYFSLVLKARVDALERKD